MERYWRSSFVTLCHSSCLSILFPLQPQRSYRAQLIWHIAMSEFSVRTSTRFQCLACDITASDHRWSSSKQISCFIVPGDLTLLPSIQGHGPRWLYAYHLSEVPGLERLSDVHAIYYFDSYVAEVESEGDWDLLDLTSGLDLGHHILFTLIIANFETYPLLLASHFPLLFSIWFVWLSVVRFHYVIVLFLTRRLARLKRHWRR